MADLQRQITAPTVPTLNSTDKFKFQSVHRAIQFMERRNSFPNLVRVGPLEPKKFGETRRE
jgi:hypothetical protein